MNKVILGIVTAIVLTLSTGCVGSIVKGLNGLSLDTSKEASIAFAGTTVNNHELNKRGSRQVRGEGELYLLNIDTKKTIRFPINAQGLPVFGNIDVGTYVVSKWVYNTCKEIRRDKYGEEHCTQYHNLKGSSESFKGKEFEVNKGETLYIGHLTVDTKTQTLSIGNQEKSDTAKFIEKVDIKGRTIKNISDKLELQNWKFNVTGKSNLFGL